MVVDGQDEADANESGGSENIVVALQRVLVEDAHRVLDRRAGDAILAVVKREHADDLRSHRVHAVSRTPGGSPCKGPIVLWVHAGGSRGLEGTRSNVPSVELDVPRYTFQLTARVHEHAHIKGKFCGW